VNKNQYKIDENYSIKVIRTIEEFQNLKDMWNDLAEQNGSYFPWLCHEWFSLFLRFFYNGSELFIVILFRGKEAIALAPFILRKETYKGIAKVKKIELIGNVHSPVRNFLFGHSSEEEKKVRLSVMLRNLIKVYRDWDIIELERLPTEHNTFFLIKDVVIRNDMRFREYFCTDNWYLDEINYSSEQYFDNREKSFRKNIEYNKKRFQKNFNVKMQIKFDDNKLEKYLDLYDETRKKSWKAPESDKTFVQEYTKLVCKKGWLRFAFLYADDVPISSQRWIVCQKKAYIWSLLYDQDYKKYSPGSILSCELCRYVIDEDKVNTIDYLTGDEPYKKFWTPNRRERRGILIFNNNIKGNVLAFLILSILPLFEKSRFLRSAKKKISGLLKNFSYSK
jgi:Acetyltransferase (GNAT) domain